MKSSLKLACAQVNPCVGDVRGNVAHILAAWEQAEADGADLMLLPEMAVSGYPAEDLVCKPDFMRCVHEAVAGLVARTRALRCAALVTAPWMVDGRRENVALLVDGGEIRAVVTKQRLPNYGVFDEVRVFSPGRANAPIDFRGARLGVLLCEDGWAADVAASLKAQGADVLLMLNASPFSEHKRAARLAVARARCAESGLALVYVNLVGGQDELVFDGAGFALDADGSLAAAFPAWRSGVSSVMLEPAGGACRITTRFLPSAPPEAAGEMYAGMLLGLRDYVGKNAFKGVLLGLSGGIDSALVAVAAVDALGASRVVAVAMPSRHTSDESNEDAAAIARALGIRLLILGIDRAHRAFEGMLADVLDQPLADLTEQNLQARSRGVALMALSNQLEYMLLTTGNKSEMAVGYSTLYGDMCGGFNPLKDLYKTRVYEVSRWRNRVWPAGALGPMGAPIPERVLTKAPSAELKPGQVDQDSLPPYDVLDAILHGLVEEELPHAELVARGLDQATVERIHGLLERSEYKRRQSPPGVKLSERALSRERRYPITNSFRPGRVAHVAAPAAVQGVEA
jgi:NAD+ synthase